MPGKFLADLPALARMRLRDAGVLRVSAGVPYVHRCSEVFSYRRDGVTGRMGALIRLRG